MERKKKNQIKQNASAISCVRKAAKEIKSNKTVVRLDMYGKQQMKSIQTNR
jgi:hypothetical protein